MEKNRGFRESNKRKAQGSHMLQCNINNKVKKIKTLDCV